PRIFGSPRLAADTVVSGPQLPAATTGPVPATPVEPAPPVTATAPAPLLVPLAPLIAVPPEPPVVVVAPLAPAIAGVLPATPLPAALLGGLPLAPAGVGVVPAVPTFAPAAPAGSEKPATPVAAEPPRGVSPLLPQPNSPVPATITVADAQRTYRCLMISSADPVVWTRLGSNPGAAYSAALIHSGA
ncbi:MAG: hypothetical protein RL701_3360, partial [Pseudomonadota bacterium]